MKKILFLYPMFFLLVNLASCQNSTIEQKHSANQKVDSIVLKESINQIDTPINDYLSEEIKPIRENFKRLNSIENKDWGRVETKNLEGTNEGGEVTFYNWNNQLDKIITKRYGETFQVLSEYYLLDGQLSFVFEKTLKYNRPIYHDSLAMKELNDKEVFDIAKSEIIEDRNYFKGGNLLHQISSEDCGSPFTKEYLKIEEKRILAEFDKLIAKDKE